MKKRLPIDSSIFEFLILIFLAMASLFYLNGCTITPKALQLANEKAAPQYEYWNIKKNGTINTAHCYAKQRARINAYGIR